MITCPRCGAENKPEATVCRMCATTLDPAAMMPGYPRQPQPPAQEIPATVLIPSPGAPTAAPAGAATGKITCPGCQATNDADWAFCQQCGTRLHSAPQPPPAVPQPNWGAPTVVTPNPGYGAAPPPPGHDPRFAPTVVTPGPGFPAPPPPDLPTVVTPPSVAAPPVPPPPPVHDPSLFAPTVVTPAPDFPFPPPPPPVVPPSAADVPTDQLSGPGTVQTPPGPAARPVQEPAARPTDGAGMPASPPAGMPPTSEKTMVMVSTPVASPPKRGRLHLIMEGGETGDTYDLRPTETVIGRVDGDIKFPHDGYMSGRHARIIQRNGRFYLIDNNSRNGTFIKIHQEIELNPGDVILVGKQLFRFDAEE